MYECKMVDPNITQFLHLKVRYYDETPELVKSYEDAFLEATAPPGTVMEFAIASQVPDITDSYSHTGRQGYGGSQSPSTAHSTTTTFHSIQAGILDQSRGMASPPKPSDEAVQGRALYCGL